MIGQNVAHYRVTDRLGVGGMGEVYRAHDSKLHRDVALKVLPPALAQDPDYMARFAREAQVLASLNHPNIASVYGLEEAAGATALVKSQHLGKLERLELTDWRVGADEKKALKAKFGKKLVI